MCHGEQKRVPRKTRPGEDASSGGNGRVTRDARAAPRAGEIGARAATDAARIRRWIINPKTRGDRIGRWRRVETRTTRRAGHALSAVAEHDGVPRVVAMVGFGDVRRHLVVARDARGERRRSLVVMLRFSLAIHSCSSSPDAGRGESFQERGFFLPGVWSGSIERFESTLRASKGNQGSTSDREKVFPSLPTRRAPALGALRFPRRIGSS